MILRILLVMDALAMLAVLILVPTTWWDSTVNGDDILLWLVLLGGMGAVLYYGHRLGRRGRPGAASLVLLVVAVPACLIGALALALAIWPLRLGH